MHFHGGYVRRDNAAGGGDGPGSERYAGTDHGLCANPRTALTADRSSEKPHVGRGPVVISGAKVHSLRKATMCAYGDLRQIVDPQILSEPRVIANVEIP